MMVVKREGPPDVCANEYPFIATSRLSRVESAYDQVEKEEGDASSRNRSDGAKSLREIDENYVVNGSYNPQWLQDVGHW